MTRRTRRVLSIQSHVAFGYVGGKAAVFPLQCLGYDVDVVNSVNFSNHSGYGRFGGSRASATELSSIFQIMEQNGLLIPERLLTGYIPGAEALSAVKELAEKLRQKNPELLYLLDPVLGDAGKLYVAPDVIPIYRSALPYSTIITPNWFEVEVLTDVQISDPASLRRAIRILHDEYRVPNVIISSIPLKAWLKEILPTHVQPSVAAADDQFLACISSSSSEDETGRKTRSVHASCLPCLPGYFSGVGDLFSALVLAHFHPSADSCADDTETPLSRAVSHALTKTHAILTLTHEYSEGLPEDERLATDEELDAREPERKVRRMKGRELRLIQSQDIIRGVTPVEYRRMELWTDFWVVED
ncbi:putative pyridoxal kinase BUD16 [Grifola frondosa]|uniref:pyridoxal kinase n=1 Tax=Grifola frondosa TaxID=5627 RepID=A0A1C7MAD8_GRIFR|nr:putative pyridoxal kinase BUD16 [Grifola frondosa]